MRKMMRNQVILSIQRKKLAFAKYFDLLKKLKLNLIFMKIIKFQNIFTKFIKINYKNFHFLYFFKGE